MASSAVVAINPSIKRKSAPKSDRQDKKSEVSLEPVVGLIVEGKMVTPAKHRVGKGFMKALSNVLEKLPVFLCEDSKHALEQISSIISVEDYEDLRNHSTEVMGESGLFAVTQVIRSVTFLFVGLILMNIKLTSCTFRQW